MLTASTICSVLVTSTSTKHAADFLGELVPAVGLHVSDDDAGAEIGELAGSGGADTGCPARDDCTCSFEFHSAELTDAKSRTSITRVSVTAPAIH